MWTALGEGALGLVWGIGGTGAGTLRGKDTPLLLLWWQGQLNCWARKSSFGAGDWDLSSGA